MVFNRASGELEREQVFERWFMELFYGTWPGRRVTSAVLRRRLFSILYGLAKRTPWSARQIQPFIARYGVDVEELERPPERYRTFADFFVRRLRPEARPIDRDPARLIAPADGRLLAYEAAEERVVPVKGRPYRLGELVRDRALGRACAGGLCLVLRLAPVDYHRFCYLDRGSHGPVRRIPGDLHSVNPLALAAGFPILTGNARAVTLLETAGFGRVVQVDVGAMVVGSLVYHQPGGGACERGQEMGYFALGGSTIVLLLERGVASVDDDIAEQSRRGIECLVRYGAGIGRSSQAHDAGIGRQEQASGQAHDAGIGR
jgi:phosphatidylserine decarboxylase